MLERPAVPDDEGNAGGENVHGQRMDSTDFLDGGIGASERDSSTDVACGIKDDVTDTVSCDGNSEQKQCEHALFLYGEL